MSGRAYYNEHEPYAAQWLRNLIAAGHIADGDVDARDIRDVRPADVAPYRQAHFFAGIGLWSLALRYAGWPDTRAIWTGSCPCQPFSNAGARAGFADPRHLWPEWFRLIRECRPVALCGEQVASPDGLRWLDLVFDDLEGSGYACGAVDFPSAGVGAPNIRQRLFWVADARGERRQQERRGASGNEAADGRAGRNERKPDCDHVVAGHGAPGGGQAARQSTLAGPDTRRLDDTILRRLPHAAASSAQGTRWIIGGRAVGGAGGPPNPWSKPEWVDCADGRQRPFEPGSFPLAARHPGDVAKLRAYGNAINPIAAAAVIRAWMDCAP